MTQTSQYEWVVKRLEAALPHTKVIAEPFDFNNGYGVVLDKGKGKDRYRQFVVLKNDDGWQGRRGFDINTLTNKEAVVDKTIKRLSAKFS